MMDRLREMSSCLIVLAMGLTIGLVQAVAAAGELPREAVLPLSLATKAASTAIEKCTKDGYKVSAAVVDRAGVLRVLMRADGAGSHTPDSSRKKAYTAASLGRTTSELGELLVKMPHLQAVREMNENILILGGGLPIQFGKDIVGAIGVGGAPGTQFDDACAQAGLDAIGAEKKKVPATK
jgi:uncharacterized protein GlcG (DUF336 family)